MITPKKEMKDVHCLGTLPGTNQRCGAVLCQTDGENLIVEDLYLNPGQKRQRLKCVKCGFVKIWKQNKPFSDDEK